MAQHFKRISSYIHKGLIRLKEKVVNKEIKAITLQSFPFWCASIITGLLAVMYSEIFRLVEEMHEHFEFFHNFWIFLIIPFAFFLSWWVVDKFSKEASGSGIPQLMAGIELAGRKNQKKKINIFLSIRIILTKLVSSVILLLGGGAIGREGPTIQISGAIFNVVNNYIPSYWPQINRKLMLISGGAAGLAAAFNTPLGGIVFAIEELGKTHLNTIRTHLFTAVIIAGLTSQLFIGSYLYIGTPQVPAMEAFGTVYVVLAAIVAGYFGFVFSNIIRRVVNWKNKFSSRSFKVSWVLALGLLFAVLVFFTGNDTVGSGKTLMSDIIFEDTDVAWYTLPSRFFGTIMSYVSGGAGGIFAPSLAIGASLGDSLVLLFNTPELKNLIIIVGMIGLMTGVTHAPFTSFILVYEMSSGNSSVFPLMLAAVISYATTKSFDRHSLYGRLASEYIKSVQPQKKKSSEQGKLPN